MTKSKHIILCILILIILAYSSEAQVPKKDFTIPKLNLEMVWIEDICLWVSRYETTVGQYKLFIEETDHKTTSEKKGKTFVGSFSSIYTSQGFRLDEKNEEYVIGLYWENSIPNQSLNHPVECMSGNDASAFCKWLTNLERKNNNLSDSLEYRLPTVSEWQNFASCGKKDILYPWGDAWPPPLKTVNLLDETNIKQHLKDYNDGFVYTAPIGSFKPNNWGLYDVGGNVAELVTPDSKFDPKGMAKGMILRMGGSWSESYWPVIRIFPLVYLTDSSDEDNYVSAGFRVVLAPCEKN